MRCLNRWVLWGAAGLMSVTPVLAAGPPMSGISAVPQIVDNETLFDVNNLEMFVTNHGSFGWDLVTGDPGTEFPRGTDKTVIFASGLWIVLMFTHRFLVS